MMYDDIAYSDDNPHKGEIYNQPGGENVYAGVKKGSKHSYLFSSLKPLLALSLDYTGEDVTAENFLSVLRGNKAAMQGTGSGKVLESGPNDDGIYFNYCSFE